jgi:hypothetical protein
MKYRYGFERREDFSIPKTEAAGSVETLVSFGVTSHKTIIFVVTAVKTSNHNYYFDEKIKEGEMDKVCGMHQ